jgi:translation elongation factor EF-1beta
VVSSRPPNLQKTEEKLKNPQEPNTRAVESQEGLKDIGFGFGTCHMQDTIESQEGLKAAGA